MLRLDVTSDTMASFIMGKNVYLPWRSQSNVTAILLYDEWVSFISDKDNLELLSNRSPLKYSRILEANNKELLLYRYFMYDCSWSLYNEIMMSTNSYLDATVIVPSFLDGIPLSKIEVLKEVSLIVQDDFDKYYERLRIANPKCLYIPYENMSKKNKDLFYLCIYLQSLAVSKSIKRINIDWR